MSKFRKPFLAILKPLWRQRLPDWQPEQYSPSFWTSPDATFSYVRHAPADPTRFHILVEFTSKSPGRFTGDFFITGPTNHLEPKGIHRLPGDIASLRLGAYRIGWFMSGADVWWHLKDEAAEWRQFRESIGLPGSACPFKRRSHDWYASSYEKEQAEIMREAAEHFIDSFHRYVVPKITGSA